jgi:hypothetical protein
MCFIQTSLMEAIFVAMGSEDETRNLFTDSNVLASRQVQRASELLSYIGEFSRS